MSAQSTTGRISGTVLDASQAPLPSATVTATEEATGISRTAETDSTGAYIFVSLPRGKYTVSAEAKGFKKVVRTSNELVADGRLTVDFRMALGDLTEAIEVTAPGESLNTTSGEVARTVDRDQVQNLALNGRNYLQLATLIPGTPLVDANALELMTSLNINTNVNGSRGNTSLLMVDGGFNMDSGSNNSQVSNVGIDFIEEVNMKTANFSAEYGRNSGAAINVVTRSGGNDLHGSVFEYHRNESFDANDYFLNSKKLEKSPLTYNNFGYAVGGPIIKNKLFFFVGQEWKKIDRQTSAVFRNLPTRAMRNGDFSALTTPIVDPLTGQPFPGNLIPADRITPDGRAVAGVYSAMETLADSYDDRPVSNNALFQGDSPYDFRQEILRLDYHPSASHRLTLRILHDTYNVEFPFGTFIDSQLPTVPTNRERPGNNWQLSHIWSVSPTIVNEFKINAAWHSQRIPPVGDSWKRETYGFEFPQVFPEGGKFAESIPDTTVSGYASFAGAARSLVAPTTDIQIGDNLTLLKGAHTLKVGGLYVRNRKDQNSRSLYAGSVEFNPSGNPKSTGNAFADALLGNFLRYSESEGDQVGFFRFSQLEAFVSDSWRLSPTFSIEAGLRYAWHQPMYAQANNIANFDPARYDAARAVTVTRDGKLVAGSGDRFNGIIRAGDGVPEQELSRVPTGDTPLTLSLPAGAPRGLYDARHLIAPRFSFAWAPGSGRTAIRGGIGLFYDRVEGNLHFGGGGGGTINNPPYNLSTTLENANLADPTDGTPSAQTILGTISAVDPNLEVPALWSWSLTAQRELGRGIFGEIGYIGSRANHLTRQIDVNLPSFADLSANLALPAAEQAKLNFLRPYKGYSAIFQRVADGESKYNALQLFLSKRRGGLRWTLSYTLSRSEDNGSGTTSGQNFGEVVDFASNPTGNWGPSDYDRTHIVVGTFTWQIPIFKQRQGVGRILGGWEVSGIGRYQTGAPYSVTAATAMGGNRRADVNGDPYNAEPLDPDTGVITWINKAAFSAAPETRLGGSERNQFRGPSLHTWDVSLRKQFVLKDDVKLQIQADFFNVMNHANFRNPESNIASGAFGTITQLAVPPRNVQLSGRLTF